MSTTSRELLRHTVATLAYRSRKILQGAPPEFATFKAAPRTRRPARILAHMGDLMGWALHMADGEMVWQDSRPLPWDEEVARFYAGVAVLDGRLATDEPLGYPPEKLFQGPLADAFWHLGQLALLRGMVDAPIRGENYLVADIEVGCVGPDQADPRREF